MDHPTFAPLLVALIPRPRESSSLSDQDLVFSRPLSLSPSLSFAFFSVSLRAVVFLLPLYGRAIIRSPPQCYISFSFTFPLYADAIQLLALRSLLRYTPISRAASLSTADSHPFSAYSPRPRASTLPLSLSLSAP